METREKDQDRKAFEQAIEQSGIADATIQMWMQAYWKIWQMALDYAEKKHQDERERNRP